LPTKTVAHSVALAIHPSKGMPDQAFAFFDHVLPPSLLLR
jgi:hypothetical protein